MHAVHWESMRGSFATSNHSFASYEAERVESILERFMRGRKLNDDAEKLAIQVYITHSWSDLAECVVCILREE